MSDLLCLQIPADFERLPEYRMLCVELRSVAAVGKRNRQSPIANRQEDLNGDAGDDVPTDKQIEAAANFLWMRLWVELAYLAQTTNRPGYLTSQGAELFRHTLDPLFGDDCDPVQLLMKATVLEVRSAECGVRNGNSQSPEWFCPLFARMNAHTAGNYVSREVRGANHSALVRNQQRIAADAARQGSLLPDEVYRRGDGAVLNATEIQKVLVLIKTVDNCLKLPNRTTGGYSAGLIADAASVVEKRDQTRLREVYLWIANHRELPALPKTTEQVLREWEMVEAMAGAST